MDARSPSTPQDPSKLRVEIFTTDAQHLEAIAPLFEAQLREHGVSPDAEILRASLHTVLERASHGFILAAYSQGIPIGVAYAACILSIEYGGLSGWLDELYVQPAYRGLGVGSQLLQSVVHFAKEREWRAIDLEVDAQHQRAIALYHRLGFEPVARTRLALRIPRP